MTLLTPEFLQTQDYGADKLRHLLEHVGSRGEGVSDYGFAVTQRGAGANMSVDVPAGNGWVRGDSVARQGLYRIENDATANVAVGAAHATLPRLDQVVARIYDSSVSGGSDTPALEVVAGTATSGATLDNRTGAAALPASAMLLADILVGAAATNIVNADIRDRRSFAALIVPPLLTKADIVPLIPVGPAGALSATGGPIASNQQAYAVYLPRRIVSATRIRWAAASSVASSTIMFALYDASGRKIIDTGSVSAAVTGRQSTAITATTLEPGVYYLVVGAGATANTNIIGKSIANYLPGLSLSGSGGTTAASTILGFSEGSGSTITDTVPLAALSVG